MRPFKLLLALIVIMIIIGGAIVIFVGPGPLTSPVTSYMPQG